jgi:hypothetical protein
MLVCIEGVLGTLGATGLRAGSLDARPTADEASDEVDGIDPNLDNLIFRVLSVPDDPPSTGVLVTEFQSGSSNLLGLVFQVDNFIRHFYLVEVFLRGAREAFAG